MQADYEELSATQLLQRECRRLLREFAAEDIGIHRNGVDALLSVLVSSESGIRNIICNYAIRTTPITVSVDITDIALDRRYRVPGDMTLSALFALDNARTPDYLPPCRFSNSVGAFITTANQTVQSLLEHSDASTLRINRSIDWRVFDRLFYS